MLFLDKEQKTFKQLKGEKGEEDVVGHDVLFNLRKPGPEHARAREPAQQSRDDKLEHVVADAIREHLRGLPGRILADKLNPRPPDMEILGWIGHLYDGASFIEQEAVGLSDSGEESDLPEEAAKLYGMMPRLLQAVLKDTVEPNAYAKAQRQCRLAALKRKDQARQQESKQSAPRQPTSSTGSAERNERHPPKGRNKTRRVQKR